VIVEHLDAYEVALVVWSFLFGLLGLQGLISTYLEGEVDTVGTHSEPKSSVVVVVLMAALTATIMWSAWTFAQQLLLGSSETLGWLAALMSLAMSALIALYRRYFISDEVIAQARNDGVPW
jgi:hypothetical protein